MTKSAAILIVCLMLLCAWVMPVGATATPTPITPSPTITLRPIMATPTSPDLYFRNTPTPWNPATPATVYFTYDFEGKPELMADTAINAYRFLNQFGLIDVAGIFSLTLGWALILFYLIRYIMRHYNN
jgi:hypothetical protein